eukprot:7459319-Karenia_brevis.AAC.1
MHREAKADFRANYAKDLYNSLKRNKEKGEKYSEIDVDKGEYLLPFKILENEGGPRDPAAVKATKMIIEKCIRMGSPWTWRDGQSERLLFLRFRKTVDN